MRPARRARSVRGARPEHADNLAIPFVVGDLGLTAEEEAAVVAYLKTFTDTHTPKPPKPYH